MNCCLNPLVIVAVSVIIVLVTGILISIDKDMQE